MGTLLVSNLGSLITGNRDPINILGSPEAFVDPYHRYLRVQAHRTIWFANPGDVLILPTSVDSKFIEYTAELRGFDAAELTILPPETLNQSVAVIRRVVEEHGVNRIWPYYFDRTIAAFARALGLPVPGFVYQSGAELLNSKIFFRALAAGTNAPIADGWVPTTRADAEEYIWDKLSEGRCVILKEDFHVGGLGNIILSPGQRVTPIGAVRAEICADQKSVKDTLDHHWATVADHEMPKIVIEQYEPDARSIYAGFSLTDDGVSIYGHGEMRMMPVINGLITPILLNNQMRKQSAFLHQAERLSAAVQRMGYRGQLSVDGILTTEGEVFLTEFNARSGGATHNHCIMNTLVARSPESDRIMLDRRRCDFPPLGLFLSALRSEGLLFNQANRTGVVVTVHDGGLESETGEFCVIAENLAQAEQMEEAVNTLIRKMSA
jgi:hypothetical protein